MSGDTERKCSSCGRDVDTEFEPLFSVPIPTKEETKPDYSEAENAFIKWLNDDIFIDYGGIDGIFKNRDERQWKLKDFEQWGTNTGGTLTYATLQLFGKKTVEIPLQYEDGEVYFEESEDHWTKAESFAAGENFWRTIAFKLLL
jgi:hypothetical protein